MAMPDAKRDKLLKDVEKVRDGTKRLSIELPEISKKVIALHDGIVQLGLDDEKVESTRQELLDQFEACVDMTIAHGKNCRDLKAQLKKI